jgi:hypothetical protein
VILGCAMAILKGALGILWWLLAPKGVRKARRRAGKTAHRARAKAPKQAKKMQRAARRSISPKPKRRMRL